MGGRGSTGKSGGSGTSAVRNNIVQSLNSSRTYEVVDELEKMPVGTQIYDGSTTTTDRTGTWKEENTFYQKTSKYGWTMFGDTERYDARASEQVASELYRKSRNPKFNLKIK